LGETAQFHSRRPNHGDQLSRIEYVQKKNRGRISRIYKRKWRGWSGNRRKAAFSKYIAIKKATVKLMIWSRIFPLCQGAVLMSSPLEEDRRQCTDMFPTVTSLEP
jgi:hypothetical protein